MSRIDRTQLQDIAARTADAHPAHPAELPETAALVQRFEDMLGADRAPRESGARTQGNENAPYGSEPYRGLSLEADRDRHAMRAGPDQLQQSEVSQRPQVSAQPQQSLESQEPRQLQASQEPPEAQESQRVQAWQGTATVTRDAVAAPANDHPARARHEDQQPSSSPAAHGGADRRDSRRVHDQPAQDARPTAGSARLAKARLEAAKSAALLRKQHGKTQARELPHEDAAQPVAQASVQGAVQRATQPPAPAAAQAPQGMRGVRGAHFNASSSQTHPGSAAAQPRASERIPPVNAHADLAGRHDVSGPDLPPDSANGYPSTESGVDPTEPEHIQVAQHRHQEVDAATQVAIEEVHAQRFVRDSEATAQVMIEVVQAQHLAQVNTPEPLPLHLLGSI